MVDIEKLPSMVSVTVAVLGIAPAVLVKSPWTVQLKTMVVVAPAVVLLIVIAPGKVAVVQLI